MSGRSGWAVMSRLSDSNARYAAKKHNREKVDLPVYGGRRILELRSYGTRRRVSAPSG
jgi:hypothetical protein